MNKNLQKSQQIRVRVGTEAIQVKLTAGERVWVEDCMRATGYGEGGRGISTYIRDLGIAAAADEDLNLDSFRRMAAAADRVTLPLSSWLRLITLTPKGYPLELQLARARVYFEEKSGAV